MADAAGVGSDLDRWLEPFLEDLGHKKRRGWAPLYLRGLLGPSERKRFCQISRHLAGRSLRAEVDHPR
jgi:hypothetical protein